MPRPNAKQFHDFYGQPRLIRHFRRTVASEKATGAEGHKPHFQARRNGHLMPCLRGPPGFVK
jgi:hypothetical protein